MMPNLKELRVKLFADGADIDVIKQMAANPMIKGFTTNPTLMRQAGVTDYVAFAREVLKIVPDRPISFEVFSDDFQEMEQQAQEIASWGSNVFVKIPITNTRGESAISLIKGLGQENIQLNVTAILTDRQVAEVAEALDSNVAAFVSVFAGRIADTGLDPILIWASPRELLNVFQAEAIGCHVLTATPNVLGKLSLVGKDLTSYSLETVEMFRQDALKAGFSIPLSTKHSNKNI